MTGNEVWGYGGAGERGWKKVPSFSHPISAIRYPLSYPMISPHCIIGSLLLLATAGCASHIDRLQPIRDEFYLGHVETAEKLLNEQLPKRRRETDVLKLDKAVIELAAGRPNSSEKLLRDVRDRFDYLEQKDGGEAALSFVTDDNAIAYAGEDYEKVLIRAFLAISNLMTDGGDAAAYALQVTDKQQEIIDKVTEKHPDNADIPLAYKQVALGPYVRAMLAEESPLTLDDAAKARTLVVNWAPEFRDARADLQRAQFEQPIRPGHGALFVFTLVGRGPVKEEVSEVPTQAAMLIADRIVSAISPRGLPPTLAPVLVPKVFTPNNPADGVLIAVDGQTAGVTATLVDVGEMASRQQDALFPQVMARLIARRVLKKGVIYGVKEVTDANPNTPLSFALNVVGIAWEATETADTRCWGLLPEKIQVLRLELPAGEHQLTLQPARGHTPIGIPAPKTIHIAEGRNTYLLGNFPGRSLVGKLITSGEEPASRGLELD